MSRYDKTGGTLSAVENFCELSHFYYDCGKLIGQGLVSLTHGTYDALYSRDMYCICIELF
jgi:hypothetical protein